LFTHTKQHVSLQLLYTARLAAVALYRQTFTRAKRQAKKNKRACSRTREDGLAGMQQVTSAPRIGLLCSGREHGTFSHSKNGETCSQTGSTWKTVKDGTSLRLWARTKTRR